MLNSLVVHCKKSKFDVYIGRPGKWGNPFSNHSETSAPIHVASREDAVECYKQWILGGQQKIHDRLKLTRPTIEEIKRELKGKVLGCWCAPQACHGEILAEIANG